MAGTAFCSVFGIECSLNKYLRTYFMPKIIDIKDIAVKKAKTLLASEWKVT